MPEQMAAALAATPNSIGFLPAPIVYGAGSSYASVLHEAKLKSKDGQYLTSQDANLAAVIEKVGEG